jgi:hypothetical protein
MPSCSDPRSLWRAGNGTVAGAGIAVPVPGAADAAAGLADPHLQPELAQLVELVKTGNAGADDDRVEIRSRACLAVIGLAVACCDP